MPDRAMLRPIGGFLPLRLPASETSSDSPLAQWTNGFPTSWLLHNARSALHALWDVIRPRRIWLPAYVCAEVAASVPSGVDTSYYPLDERLLPRVDFLSGHILDGNHVLAIDYFGRPANPEFIDLVHIRPDIGWVEDRAHVLDPPDSAWGDWLLYSPRKLFGVPDGGILVAHRKALWPLPTTAATDFSFALPLVERFEDRNETDNQRWYTNYVQQEAAMGIGMQSMSRLSLELLKALDARGDRAVRRENYRILHDRLRQYAYFPEAVVSFAPLGFPIRAKSAATLSKGLSERGIFAARHWANLPSDPLVFATEHRLAKELLTLPCDYRYGEADMHRVADAVFEAMTERG